MDRRAREVRRVVRRAVDARRVVRRALRRADRRAVLRLAAIVIVPPVGVIMSEE